MGNIELETLSTRGVVTHVAKHLYTSKYDLQTLYMLFNDKAYRQEIRPFVVQRVVEHMIRKVQRYNTKYEMHGDQVRNSVLSIMYTSVYYLNFFEHDNAIRALHKAFPEYFLHCLNTYKIYYSLVSISEKQAQIDKSMRLIEQGDRPEEDLFSFHES
jgi:hypothetical protein